MVVDPITVRKIVFLQCVSACMCVCVIQELSVSRLQLILFQTSPISTALLEELNLVLQSLEWTMPDMRKLEVVSVANRFERERGHTQKSGANRIKSLNSYLDNLTEVGSII